MKRRPHGRPSNDRAQRGDRVAPAPARGDRPSRAEAAGRGPRREERAPREDRAPRSFDRGGDRGADRGPRRDDRGPRRDEPHGGERLDLSPHFDGIPPPFEIVFGMNPVREALLAGRRKYRRLFVARREESPAMKSLLELAKQKNVTPVSVEREELEVIVSHSASGDAGGIQGIALVATPYRYFSLEEIAGPKTTPEPNSSRRRILALDEIEDPRNLGAMARTAETAGFRGLVIQEHRAASATAVAVKSSAGALEHLKVARETNIADALERLKELGYWIVGLDAAGQDTRSIYDVDLDMDLCLVVGAEGKGLRPRVRSACELVVSLPMAGKVGSLNASAACAAAIYQVLRPRAPRTTRDTVDRG